MNNIIYDDEICLKGHIYRYYKTFTEKLNHRDCVKFSLFCAKIVNPNIKESNDCIELVERWLVDENSVSRQELRDAASAAAITSAAAANAANAASAAANAAYSAAYAVYIDLAPAIENNWIIIPNTIITATTAKINKYLQILLRKTKQFQNNQVLEQISKTDVDTLELVDWNMITDIMQEEYNIIHEFEYCDIFSRRCLIELLRREYT